MLLPSVHVLLGYVFASQLILVAYDLGQPVPYETTQPLQVVLLDIDDNEPFFLKPPVSWNYSTRLWFLSHAYSRSIFSQILR